MISLFPIYIYISLYSSNLEPPSHSSVLIYIKYIHPDDCRRVGVDSTDVWYYILYVYMLTGSNYDL